jgi:hypothetical protein
MDMNACLFPRKKEETKLAVTNNSRCHAVTVTNLSSGRLTNERDFPIPSEPRPVRVAVYGN